MKKNLNENKKGQQNLNVNDHSMMSTEANTEMVTKRRVIAPHKEIE